MKHLYGEKESFPPETRMHPLSLTAFIISIVGIPLVGLITGMVAALVGAMALGQITADSRFRGKGLAVAAMVVGLAEVAGWALLIALLLLPWEPSHRLELKLPAFPSRESIENAPPPLRRALEANVFLTVRSGSSWFYGEPGTDVGSGVVVGRKGDRCLILTSRHLVEPSFQGEILAPPHLSDSVDVYFYDGSRTRAYPWWVAPFGVDLALLATGPEGEEIPLDRPSHTAKVRIGDKVFAVGNPHQLNWSYSEGVISGIREKVHAAFRLRILQTQTPINTGSSGGGLYLSDGAIVGIVSWTRRKSLSEGIGFAISYNDFLDLYALTQSPAEEKNN